MRHHFGMVSSPYREVLELNRSIRFCRFESCGSPVLRRRAREDERPGEWRNRRAGFGFFRVFGSGRITRVLRARAGVDGANTAVAVRSRCRRSPCLLEFERFRGRWSFDRAGVLRRRAPGSENRQPGPVRVPESARRKFDGGSQRGAGTLRSCRAGGEESTVGSFVFSSTRSLPRGRRRRATLSSPVAGFEALLDRQTSASSHSFRFPVTLGTPSAQTHS